LHNTRLKEVKPAKHYIIMHASDPKVMVYGYGILRRSKIRTIIKEYIEKSNKEVQNAENAMDYKRIFYFTHKSGTLETMLEAEMVVAKELGEI